MSPHTILSYRDSLKLFLLFVSEQNGVSVSDLAVEDIGESEVIDFLDYLERDRSNGVGTRNIRLSAIHSFFRYLAGVHPEHLDQSQRILSIPFKRASTSSVDYLEFDEIMALLGSIERSKTDCRRDYALLALILCTHVGLWKSLRGGGRQFLGLLHVKALDVCDRALSPSISKVEGGFLAACVGLEIGVQTPNTARGSLTTLA